MESWVVTHFGLVRLVSLGVGTSGLLLHQKVFPSQLQCGEPHFVTNDWASPEAQVMSKTNKTNCRRRCDKEASRVQTPLRVTSGWR
jgi:hypothetical protein